MLQPSKSHRKPLETLHVDNLRIEPARYDIPRHCRAGARQPAPLPIVGMGVHGVQPDFVKGDRRREGR